MEEQETVKIFWTGGWDSTFMFINELRKNKKVQPIYIINGKRKSNITEQKVMDKIMESLQQYEDFKEKILPLKKIKLEDIEQNEKILKAYQTISKVTGLGRQHEYLARYAFENPGILLGHENGISGVGHMTSSLKKYCVLTRDEEGIIILDKDKSTEEGNLIFGNLKFPIMDYTEKEMVDKIKEWQMEDVMKNIWFCHRPIKGMPCGMCHPCNVKVNSGMEFLLPEEALKRNEFINSVGKKYGKTIQNLVRKSYRLIYWK